jgi:hypothetical protein
MSTLDASMTRQQFGGRSREVDLLTKIEGHTKRTADKNAGGLRAV